MKSIHERLAAHQTKVKAREARIRKEESELEKERNALVDEGRRHFDGLLAALRQQAAGYAETAAKAIAALPAKPVKPEPELVDTVGFDEYAAAANAYPAKAKAYEEAAIAASRPLAVALRGLTHQAGAVRNEARALGLACFNGVGFLHECERGAAAVAGTALSAYGHQFDNPVAACIALAEGGALTARQAVALALLLRNQPEQPSAEKPDIVWARMKQIAAKAEADAEIAARGGAPLTQQEVDAKKYVDGFATTGGRPLPAGSLNLELDRKAREAAEQRSAERRAEEERQLETIGFARTGGEA